MFYLIILFFICPLDELMRTLVRGREPSLRNIHWPRILARNFCDPFIDRLGKFISTHSLKIAHIYYLVLSLKQHYLLCIIRFFRIFAALKCVNFVISFRTEKFKSTLSLKIAHTYYLVLSLKQHYLHYLLCIIRFFRIFAALKCHFCTHIS